MPRLPELRRLGARSQCNFVIACESRRQVEGVGRHNPPSPFDESKGWIAAPADPAREHRGRERDRSALAPDLFSLKLSLIIPAAESTEITCTTRRILLPAQS